MKKISQTLKEERLANNLSLEEVEKNTKIKLLYLKFIENGEFSRLPSKAYAQGFVKNYANHLSIPQNKALALFRREYEEQQKEDFMPRFRKSQDKIGRKKFFSMKLAAVIGVALVIIGFLLFQFSSFFTPPPLEIIRPENDTQTTNIVKVVGTTDPAATVVVNEENAYVGLNGEFEKTIYLFDGEREITVKATNRFNNSVTKTINIEVVSKN